MVAHMYCVRSFMVVFLTQSVCVCVCDSECVYRGKMPRALFFFLLHSLFSDTQSDDIIHLEYKKMSCKTCQRLFRAANTPAVDYFRKKNTKDLRNMRHENKFLDLNMERVIQTSTPRLLNIIRNREEILNVRKQTGWEYRGV